MDVWSHRFISVEKPTPTTLVQLVQVHCRSVCTLSESLLRYYPSLATRNLGIYLIEAAVWTFFLNQLIWETFAWIHQAGRRRVKCQDYWKCDRGDETARGWWACDRQVADTHTHTHSHTHTHQNSISKPSFSWEARHPAWSGEAAAWVSVLLPHVPDGNIFGPATHTDGVTIGSATHICVPWCVAVCVCVCVRANEGEGHQKKASAHAWRSASVSLAWLHCCWLSRLILPACLIRLLVNV